MKHFLAFLLSFVFSISTLAQEREGTVSPAAASIRGAASAPSGSCSPASTGAVGVRIYGGAFYYCNGGTWAAMSGAGGTTINSTNGQLPYRVNGTTFGDSAIASNALNSTYLSVTSGASGAGVTVAPAGGGTNESLVLVPKGTGNVTIGTTANNGQFQVQSTVSGKPAFYIKGYTTDITINPLFQLYRGDGVLVSEITSGGYAMFGATSFAFTGTDLIGYNAAKIGWTSSGSVSVATNTLDTGFSRLSAGVVRVNNGSTGAGQLIIGTSTDTVSAQLDVRSQSTTRPAARFQAASGTSGSQELAGIYDGTGAPKLVFYPDGTFTGGGATRSGWTDYSTVWEGPTSSVFQGTVTDINFSSNAYFIAPSWKYKTTQQAANFLLYQGSLTLRSAPSGTADTNIAWTTALYANRVRLSVTAGSNISFTSSSTDASAAEDVILARDAANTLAQRNGTNAQKFSVYNTYTSGSNYERLGIQASSNAFFVTPEAATGTVRELVVGAAGSATRLRSSLATPSAPTLADGDWWVECSGTSPARTCSILVRDTGATRTIATSVAF